MFREVEQKVLKIIEMNREGVFAQSILFVICLYLYLAKMDVFFGTACTIFISCLVVE